MNGSGGGAIIVGGAWKKRTCRCWTKQRGSLMKWIRISEEVRAAVAGADPVVALESTVLAHGLPRPRNLEVGKELEAIVRRSGAVPATIAVIDGAPTVGLSGAEMERITTDLGVAKLSTRDLPIAIARGATGATTVAATAFLAARATLQVFATGGIGGVHRGFPPDISADLIELHRTPTLVVCAGAKSILDLPATRELLESLGIPLLGWQTDTMPGFYYRETPFPVDANVQSAADAAAVWRAHRQSNLPGAVLLCAPVPADNEIPRAEIETAIEAAAERAASEGIRGKDLTPFMLRTLATVTGGRSQEANIALLRNNVTIAAAVAREILP
jgi:pseudouridine-5'-phosphate glycosidase